MRKLAQIIILALALITTACGTTTGGSGVANSDLTTDSFKWTRESVFNQSLDITKVKEWGYYGNGTEKIEIADFADPNRSQLKDLIGVKPTECIPLASLIENAPQSKANYSLNQEHQDSSIPDKSMIYQVFFYETVPEAKEYFSLVKGLASTCGTYTANYLTESYSQDLWSSAEADAEDLIRAYNTEYDEANAIGLIGSAIFVLYFLDFENLIDAKTTLESAISIVSANLRTTQGI